jgi:hypothetical protein
MDGMKMYPELTITNNTNKKQSFGTALNESEIVLMLIS